MLLVFLRLCVWYQPLLCSSCNSTLGAIICFEETCLLCIGTLGVNQLGTRCATLSAGNLNQSLDVGVITCERALAVQQTEVQPCWVALLTVLIHHMMNTCTDPLHIQ